MIVVIGGIETTVKIKMLPPKPHDDEEQDAAGEEGEAVNEVTVGGLDATGFDNYIRRQRKAMQSDSYWNEVGMGSNDFGGYSAYSNEDDSDIEVKNAGCGYNVAKMIGEKLGNTDGEVVILSSVGRDALGTAMIGELNSAGVDTSKVKVSHGNTAVTVEMRNIMDDVQFMRRSAGAMKGLTPEYIDDNKELLDKADIVFMDGGLPIDVMKRVGELCEQSKLYFDPASVAGAVRFVESGCKVNGVMPGRRESEALMGMSVLGLDQLMAAGKAMEEEGIKHIIITLKGGGLYYKDGACEGVIQPERMLSFADTSGAGDVVTAEVLYNIIKGVPLKTAAQAGMDAAAKFLSDVEDASVADQLKKKGMC